MAAHKLGKLRFKFSKEGFAFRWGEGDVKLFSFGSDTFDAPELYEDYVEENDFAEGADTGVYDQYNGGYYDEGQYADEEYADEDYDAGYDTQYSDQYADDYDSQYDGQYDDSEYADDGYGDEYADEYAEGDEYYEEYPEEEQENAFFRFVDDNTWVIYVLLVLLPPLGIYLLWRSGLFDSLIRSILSAVSALIFVGIIILIIMALINPGDTTTQNNNINLVKVSPSPTAPIATLAPITTPQPTLNTDPITTPAPTAIGGLNLNSGNAGGNANNNTGNNDSSSASYVYSPSVGIYYHSSDSCENIATGVSVSRVTVATAENRGQSPCSLCYNAETFYATANGKYFHKDKSCSGMSGATLYTRVAAEREGKRECPVCITGTKKNINEVRPTEQITSFAQSITNDMSGIKVYATSGGTYYHSKSNCSGMSGASHVPLLTALQAGKTNCPRCLSAAGAGVYATPQGTYYHKTKNCSGMSGATQIPLSLALVMGKANCPTCLPNQTVQPNDNSGNNNTETSGVHVYATTGGKYYHLERECSGMRGASYIPLRTAMTNGKEACPVCCSTASNTVYATSGGTYYHSYATCSGMSGASAGTLAQALALGYKACPECWVSSSDPAPESVVPGATQAPSSTSGVTVYCTTNGKYYHDSAICSGMKNASAVTLEQAVSMGKSACPTCLSVANRTVYATSGGKYFHYESGCSNMKNAQSGTMADALMYGYAPCPVCVTGEDKSELGEPIHDYKPGTSGIKVYATEVGLHYHLDKSHAGGNGASYITLETALNYGKLACPTCASVGDLTVYAAKDSAYFHATHAHAGSGAYSGSMAQALASGMTACPTCILGEEEPEETFTPGASGIKVYANVNKDYFHYSKSCAGANTSHITLETALNYGKTPCPLCTAIGYEKVYSSEGDNRYHIYKSHAAPGAQAGYLAIAEALGKTLCPDCEDVYNNSGSGGSGEGFGGSLEYVYIDLEGDSDPYLCHLASKCSGAGMKKGSKVSVDFAKEQGFNPCEYCLDK